MPTLLHPCGEPCDEGRVRHEIEWQGDELVAVEVNVIGRLHVRTDGKDHIRGIETRHDRVISHLEVWQRGQIHTLGLILVPEEPGIVLVVDEAGAVFHGGVR